MSPLRRRLPLWPRSLRARLTASYTLAAALLTVAGAVVFLLTLRLGLQANLENDLESRADTLVVVLQDTNGRDPDLPESPPTASPGNEKPDTVVAYRRPDGSLSSATGARLPQFSLTPSFIAAAQQATARTTVEIGSDRFQVVAMPVHRSEGVWLAIAAATRGSNDEAVGEVTHALLVAGPALVALVAGGTWLLAGAALRPVERMRRDAAELGSRPGRGRLSVPETEDELAALAITLNELLERLQLSLQRQRDLVADAGHELRTPLAVLRMELELADRPGRSRDELAEAVTQAAFEAHRLSGLADDLLFLARADEGESVIRPEPIDLVRLLATAARAMQARMASASVELVLDVPGEIPAVADPAALRRAVDNVLANALEHSYPGGTIRLSATQPGSPGEESGSVRIRVEDEGQGFPDDFLPHAFERFRRADVARRHGTGHASTGLGLAIVAEVAAAHGGAAHAGNRPEGGAQVDLVLPVSPSARLAPDAAGRTPVDF